jgi:uncharacterized protein YgiM (DUF1202 family)
MRKIALLTVTFIAACIMLVLSSLPMSIVTAGPAFAATATYDPRPLCADRSGATTAIVRYDIPYGTVSSGGIYCRPLVQNGTYLVNGAEIGSQAAINLGINQAVDVYAILYSGATTTQFNNAFKVCLLGSGYLYFLDANQSPRQLQQLTGESDGTYTCASLSTAGIIMLTNASGAAPASAPAVTGTPGTPVPGATPAPGVTGTPAAIGAVGNCTLTINKIVRLRAEPNTTSKVLTRLAYNTTWKVTGRVPGWYQIVWTNTQGWVSDQFARATGQCG